MQCRTRVWLAASSLIAITGSAWAVETHAYPECATRPSENDVTAAKGAFQAGKVSFNEADYARAILYWEDAYRRDCTATPLLDYLGRAYEGAGNLEQAVIALRTYTERATDSPERTQILRRIEVFEQRIAEQKKHEPKPAQPPQTTAPVTQKPTTKTPPPPRAAEAQQARPFPWLPVAVMAVGGATALVGGLVYLNANSEVNDIEKKCGGSRISCDPNTNLASQGNDARTRATIGTGVFWGGLAVAGAGAVWFLLDSKKAPQTAEHAKLPSVSPWLGTSSAGVSWQGAF